MSAIGVELITVPIYKLIGYFHATTYVNKTETNISQVTLKKLNRQPNISILMSFFGKKYFTIKRS